MASISTGGGGGKRSVEADVPLVPMIDLLLCCIMFLLVSAVWNQMAQLQASMAQPSPESAMAAPPPDTPMLSLQVGAETYTLASSLGDEVTIARDPVALRDALRARRTIEPAGVQVAIGADDGVAYAELVGAMDALMGAGFADVVVR